jgi:hypothetical protein
MVGPYEGLSFVDRNRFGYRCTYFSGRLRRRFWLEYRVHGLTHEFTSHPKRYLSLNLVGRGSRTTLGLCGEIGVDLPLAVLGQDARRAVGRRVNPQIQAQRFQQLAVESWVIRGSRLFNSSQNCQTAKRLPSICASTANLTGC